MLLLAASCSTRNYQRTHTSASAHPRGSLAAPAAAAGACPAGAAQFFSAPELEGGNGDGQHINWMEASLEQLTTPLPPWAVRAGARETIFHDPRHTTAAIVTCGGLCPGLNDVVAVSGLQETVL